jgi:Ca2+-binding RTX toxin-like protein
MISLELFSAILSMDAYNRGYSEGILLPVVLNTTKIGNATVVSQSNITEGSEAVAAGFYAIAYDLGGAGKIISYRGTDTFSSLPFYSGDVGSDIWNGWSGGIGSTESKQAAMAFDFYKAVAGTSDPRLASITLTGHSLGGGLAGLVGGVYGKTGILFDNMPFEFALANTRAYADSNTSLKQMLYGAASPWDNNLTNLKTIYMKGEALEIPRISQVGTPDFEVSLGDDVNIHPWWPDAVALHSMSSLVIAMFSDSRYSDAVLSADWKKSAQYFWPVLYSQSFAEQIGISTLAGTSLADTKLRDIIAYSAIDEGTRVFGDTGIRALYDDANNLGKALSFASFGGASKALSAHADDVSKVFVQFAGQLALNKVLQASVPGALATAGVLTYTDTLSNKTLAVNLADEYWGAMFGAANHKADIARTNLITPILYASGAEDVIRAVMTSTWTDATDHAFNRVVFSLQETGGTDIPTNPLVSTKATLFVGGDGDNTVTIGNGRHVLLGGGGNDVMKVNATTQLSGNVYYGGEMTDTVDYRGSNFGILVSGNDVRAWNSATNIASGPTDKLLSVERVIGTNNSDNFSVTAFTNQVYDGAGGTDKVTMSSALMNKTVYDFNTGKLHNEKGTAYNTFLNFENFSVNPTVVIPDFDTPYKNFTSATVEWYGYRYEGIVHKGFDYSAAPGPLTIDVRAFHPPVIVGDQVTHNPRHATVTGAGIFHELANFHTVSGIYGGIQGSNFGDTFYTESRAHTHHFTLGKGNDVFYMQRASTGAVHINYTGGNDVIYATEMLKTITLDKSIALNDITIYLSPTDFDPNATVSSITFTMNIVNHGSLTIEYDDINGHGISIPLLSGGQISLYQLWNGLTYEDWKYTITGTSTVATELQGTWGIDNWVGRNGYNETYYGKGGNDILNGKGGSDRLFGGDGYDTAVFDEALSSYTVKQDFDRLLVTHKTSGDVDTLYGVERVQFAGVNYEINAIPGTALEDKYFAYLEVAGTSANDALSGTPENEVIRAGAGNDFLYGGAGNDVLNGGTGKDDLYGDAGDDTYVFAIGDSPIATPDTVNLIQGEGIDTIKLVGVLPQNAYMFQDSGGNWRLHYSPTDEIVIRSLKPIGPTTWQVTNDTIAKVIFDDGTVWDFTNGITINDTNDAHQYIGTSLSDTLNGNGGDDTLYGESGSDTLSGGTGNDTLTGGSGSDTISGGDGNDTITGSRDVFAANDGLPDNDTLDGGKGVDELYGSWGDDTYVFRAGDSPVATPDYIYEVVNQGTDTIKLTGGILPASVTFTKLSSNYWYSLKFGTDEIRMVNYTMSGNTASSTNTLAFEKVAFDNGTVLNLVDILNKPSTNPYPVTTGNDTVNASAATAGVTIDLLAGNDIFTGSSYSDNVSGGDGNDTIEGRAGNDIMNGGNGTDTVTYAGSTAAVTVNLATTAAQNTVGAGSDTITNFENLTGSAYNDTLTGNSGANTIDGGAGNDVIDGAAGNDILIGGTGTDRITYTSATAAVTVNLALTTAQNTIGAGTDTISGFESLTGSSYNDILTGDANANTIDGGSGNDTVQGGLGNDTLIGGSGTDTVTYVSAAAGVTVNLALTTAQNTLGAGTDTITTFENLTGSNFNDTLTGNSSSNVIEGLNGNDILDGAGGTDTVTYISAAAGVTVNLSLTTAQNTIGAGTDTIKNFENLTGSNFNDTLTGNSGSNTIEGGVGNDIMNGGTGTDKVTYANATAGVTVNLALTTAQNTIGAGTDTISAFENLTGSSFNDTLTGNSGSNTIEGGAGNDIMDGGTGTDTVTYTGATAAVTVNLALTTAQNTIGAGTDTITNFEKLTGSGYNDTLRGNTGDNTVVGGSGNDTVYGNSGNDILYGDSGTDTLYGDAGNDTLYGGSSNDTLYGGSSNDTLYGGTGSDIFKFQSSGGIDTVKDFKTSELDKLDIKSLLSGYDPLTKAITDYIQITTSGTNSIVNVDADGLTGGTVWTQIATFENVTGLTDEAALKTNGTIIA